MRCLFFCMLCGALFGTGFRAVADGPHWQVPNPEYNPDEKDEKKKEEKPKTRTIIIKGKKYVVPVPVRSGFGRGGDYKSNPGDFSRMDEACIKYYESHCAISYQRGAVGFSRFVGVQKPAKKRTKQEMRRDFYLLIMQRCAQAMREVDRYLPCPDSYPLWHEEALREEMIQYAQRTWVLSTRLPPADAAACAEYCAKAFLDTVRFSMDRRSPQGPKWLVDLGKRDQDIAKMLEQMAGEKDPKKQQKLRTAWMQRAYGKNQASLQDVRKQYPTFVLMTGDIPVYISDAELRMAEALAKMGPQVIPYLNRDPSLRNPRVRRAVQAMIETMRQRWNLNRDGISMDPTQKNVTDLVRKYAANPYAGTSQPFRRALQGMGPKAWDHMVRLAESEPPKVKQETLRLLCAFVGKPVSTKLEEIKVLVAKRLEAEKAKEKPPEKPSTVDLKPKKEEKKPPVPVAPPEDEEE